MSNPIESKGANVAHYTISPDIPRREGVMSRASASHIQELKAVQRPDESLVIHVGNHDNFRVEYVKEG